MNIQQAYNLWALQYDTNHNKTRDLEAQALRNSLRDIPFNHVLEIGCGTGKNTSSLVPGGFVYIGELHPFKQYTGSKARFDTDEGQQIVLCFNHNISEFIQSAKQNGLNVLDVNEYFDNDDQTTIPRILTIIFKKI